MKTRLYTRKRALISSVAMLLVAMIALGTATFAWFTQSPLAYAEGFKMQASSSIGLKVLSESQANALKGEDTLDAYIADSDNYVTRTYIRSNANGNGTNSTNFFLSPVTFYPTNATTNPFSAFSTIAADSDDFAKSDDQAITKATASTYNSTQGVFYKEKVYATLVGAANADETKEIRLAVSIDQDRIADTVLMKSGVIVVVTYTDSTAGTEKVVAKVAATPGDHNAYTGELAAIDYTGKTTEQEKAAVKTAYDQSVASKTTTVSYSSALSETKVGTVTTNAGRDYFTVYVGLDGMNQHVKSRNVDGKTLLNAVKLDMSIPTT